MTLIRRFFSNIIDLILLLLVVVVLFTFTKLETNETNFSFVYFLAYCMIIFLPISLTGTTFGKKIFKLNWLDQKGIKPLLFLKYFLYYVFFSPTFNFSGLLSKIILFNNSNTYDTLFPLKITVCFVITDLLIFILSSGKFHILDYLLSIQLETRNYKAKLKYSLLIIYVFFGSLFFMTILSFKYSLSSKNIIGVISHSLHRERFPEDSYSGSQVVVLKTNSSNILTTSEVFSFIYKRNYNQKIIYLNLPSAVFNSETERFKICNSLISESLTNDIFYFYKPSQTKILLTNTINSGFFYFTENYYCYYYDNTRPFWGIYGGVETDTTFIDKYIAFTDNFKKNRITSIENEFKLKWPQIIQKAKADSAFGSELDKHFSMVFNSTLSRDELSIKLDSSVITLKKIPFSKAIRRGFQNFNFPPTEMQQRIFFTDFITDRLLESDESLENLVQIRDLTTNEEL